MLIIISDLHFVDGSAGEHNLPYEAFESVFLNDIASLAIDNKAEEIKLLLLGDIFDLIRTRHWLNVPMDDRPWGVNGLQDVADVLAGRKVNPDSPTMKHCEKVLSDILEHHEVKKVMELFGDLKGRLSKLNPKLGKIPVEVLYVPGNHDRMVNLYPSLRDMAKAKLGLTVPDTLKHTFQNGEWGYPVEFKDPRYGVFARHGHLRDIWNYWDVKDCDPRGHLQVSVGDVFTTEFAVKIPFVMQKKLDELVDEGKFDKATRNQIVERLYDVDNVRPVSSVPDWIDYRLSDLDNDAVNDLLDDTLKEVIDELLSIELLQEWNSPDTILDGGLRLAARSRVRKILSGILAPLDLRRMLPTILGAGEQSAGTDQEFAKAAYDEEAWKGTHNDYKYIVYGHTHDPLIRPLDGRTGKEVLYINTGTWRPRILRTVQSDKDYDFVLFKSMTYALFYTDKEDTDKHPKPDRKKTRSFEFWNGWQRKSYT